MSTQSSDSNTDEMLDREEFMKILRDNKGAVIFKFGAEWCGPCNRIKSLVHARANRLPVHAKYYEVDVDESFELYAYLKTRKIVPAIPAILAYYKGNTEYVPDKVVLGADPDQINRFFDSI